jgi:hypothetical protein
VMTWMSHVGRGGGTERLGGVDSLANDLVSSYEYIKGYAALETWSDIELYTCVRLHGG